MSGFSGILKTDIVTVRSLCLSVVQVLEFLTGVFPNGESEWAIQLGSWPNPVSMLANQKGKAGVGSQHWD